MSNVFNPQVNARLARDAVKGEDTMHDPAFPKVQWPDSGACPSCRYLTDNNMFWDEVEVLNHLFRQVVMGIRTIHIPSINVSFDINILSLHKMGDIHL